MESAVIAKSKEKNLRMSVKQLSTTELNRNQITLVDLLDRILDKGLVINGDISISIVGVELLSLKINLVIASMETAKRYGLKLPWEKWPKEQKAKRLKVKKMSKRELR